MFEITPERRKAYQQLRHLLRRGDIQYPSYVNDICDALRDAVAAWLRAEFWTTHTANDDCLVRGRGYVEKRHNWEWPEWQAEAHKRLMGE